MKLRTLIVENEPDQLEGIERDLKAIPEKQRGPYGIEDFAVDKATCASQARRLLELAAERLEPFDLLLLDLSVPRNEGEAFEEPSIGLEILRFARQKCAAKGILVISVFSHYEYVREAFRGGAIDFIAKVYDRDVLQRQVLECWDRVLLTDSIRILEERIRALVPHAERGLAHRFSGCFSRFVQSVVSEVEKLESDLGGRLGLDMEKDAQDPLVRRLTAIERSVTDARKEWADLQNELIGKDENPHEAVVDDLLDKIVEGLLPCLTLKRIEIVRPQKGTTRVLTFQEDVRTVLTEVILGGLSEHPDHCGTAGKFEISVESKERYAEVRFVDNLAPLLGETAETINRGNAINPDGKFGRAWGLSVVQHAALRGGGRLKVERKADGNVITYLIPLAQHA